MTPIRGRALLALGPIPFLGALLAVYLLVPLVGLAVHAGSSGAGFRAPGLLSALRVSLVTATLSTVICALFGIPLAYALARKRTRMTTAVGVAVQLPLALPPLMSGILLVFLVGPYTFVGRAFGGRLTDSLVGIVLAQTFVAAPFAIVAARSAFASVDRALLDVQATLGWHEWHRFLRVSLPIASGGIQAGLALAWLRAFGEFGATVIVAYHPYSLPVFTYVQFGSVGVPETLAPTMLALVTAVALLGIARLRPPSLRRRPRMSVPPSVPLVVEPSLLAFDLDHHVGRFHLNLCYASRTPRLAILGASGAGKTLTLRCLAGLLGPHTGDMTIGARNLQGVRVEDRRIGYVPQEVALLPHLEAWQQIVAGKHADPSIGAYWSARLSIDAFEDRLPSELSGGERQRIALARALAASSELLLLDEPFSALDAPVRDALRRELRKVVTATGVSLVLVTHDPEEAALLADEILVIDGGRLLQGGSRELVFSRPASPRVAELLGTGNMQSGKMFAHNVMKAQGTLLGAPPLGLEEGTTVTWCIRPEHVRIGHASTADTADTAETADTAVTGAADTVGAGGVAGDLHRATVVEIVDLGGRVEVWVRVSGGLELSARPPGTVDLSPGDTCLVGIPKEHMLLWPEENVLADVGLGGSSDPGDLG